MPPTLVKAFDGLPPQAEGEAAAAYLDRLTPDQRAVHDAFQKEAGDGTRWLTICPTRPA